MVLTVAGESVRASSSLALGWCGGLVNAKEKKRVTKLLSMFMANRKEKSGYSNENLIHVIYFSNQK